MACSPTYGAFHAYADGISAMQASKTIYHYPVLSDISFSIKGGEKIVMTGFNGISSKHALFTYIISGMGGQPVKKSLSMQGGFLPKKQKSNLYI